MIPQQEASLKMQLPLMRGCTDKEPNNAITDIEVYVGLFEAYADAYAPTSIDVRACAFAHTQTGLMAQRGAGLFDESLLTRYDVVHKRLAVLLERWAPEMAEAAFEEAMEKARSFQSAEGTLPGNMIERSIAGQALASDFGHSIRMALNAMELAQAFEVDATRGKRNTTQLSEAVELWKTSTLAYPWTSTGNHQPTYDTYAYFCEQMSQLNATSTASGPTKCSMLTVTPKEVQP